MKFAGLIAFDLRRNSIMSTFIPGVLTQKSPGVCGERGKPVNPIECMGA